MLMRTIFLSLFVLIITSCNSDIFVDDFTPDITDMVLGGENDSRVIRFKSADWDQLTLAGDETKWSDNVTVTPVGGEPYKGKTLTGDGSISLKGELTDMTVTRRGAEVTVDLNYAIGKGDMYMSLIAFNEVTCDSYVIDMEISRVDGLEIESVDYILNSWGSSMEKDAYRLPEFSLPASATSPYTWQPVLSGGLLTFYKMSVATVDDEYLSALTGCKVPVPTMTNFKWYDWELRGDSVPLVRDLSYTHLLHYPPIPPAEVQPGSEVTLWNVTENVRFNFNMKVKNKFTGGIRDIHIWLDMWQPVEYGYTTE